MKRLFKVFVSLVVICSIFVCSCGSVFARDGYDPYEWISPAKYTMLNNETGVIGTLKTSMLDVDGKKFMEDYYKDDGSNFIVAIGNDFIYFIRPIKPFNSKSFLINAGYVYPKCDFDFVAFYAENGKPRYSTVSRIKALSYDDYRYQLVYMIQYKVMIDSGVSYKEFSFVWKPIRDGKALTVVCDDIGNEPDPPPVSSEPDPPPVSSEPDPPPVSSEPDPPPVSSEPDKPPVSSEPDPPPVSSEPDKPPVSSEPDPPPVSSEPDKPPVSSEPDKPPVSSEPDKPPPVSSEITFPSEPSYIKEEYLGFDRSTINDVVGYLSDTIGSATNIGWIIFFFIIGILVTINLIRYFSGD